MWAMIKYLNNKRVFPALNFWNWEGFQKKICGRWQFSVDTSRSPNPHFYKSHSWWIVEATGTSILAAMAWWLYLRFESLLKNRIFWTKTWILDKLSANVFFFGKRKKYHGKIKYLNCYSYTVFRIVTRSIGVQAKRARGRHRFENL